MAMNFWNSSTVSRQNGRAPSGSASREKPACVTRVISSVPTNCCRSLPSSAVTEATKMPCRSINGRSRKVLAGCATICSTPLVGQEGLRARQRRLQRAELASFIPGTCSPQKSAATTE